MDYRDFDLLVDESEHGFEAHVLRSPAGEARIEFVSPFQPLEIENLLLRLGRRSNVRHGFETDGTRAARELGRRMFDAVFQGEVQSRLQSSIQEVESEGARLRIRLRIKARKLAEIPWEYLYDSRTSQFLTLSRSTSVVRYLELPRSPRPLQVDLPLTVLVVIASPTDLPELDVQREWKNLGDALGRLPEDVVRIEKVEPTVAALQARLRRAPVHVLHFIGHGAFHDEAGDGVIVLQNEQGRSVPLPGEKLAVLLHNHPSIRLAVLNCCEGARSSANDPFSGVAPALIQRGLPAVVAMQFAIADTAAITFASTFYQSIADGCPIDDAVVEARTSMYMGSRHEESFGAPVLYMRSDDGVLFEIPPANAVKPAVLPPPIVPAVPVRMEPPPAPAQQAPPPAPQPVVTAPAPVHAYRQSEPDSIAFGLFLWLPCSIFAVAATWSLVMPQRFGSFPAGLAWSLVGVAAAVVQSLLLAVLPRWRRVTSWGESFRGALWTGIAGSVAALPIHFMPGTFGSIVALQSFELLVWTLLYATAQFFILRRIVVRAAMLSFFTIAAGTAFAALLLFSGLRNLLAVLLLCAVGAVLLAVQGFLIGRAAFRRDAPAPVATRRFAVALVALGLIQLAAVPDPRPSGGTEQVTDTMTTATDATTVTAPTSQPEPPPGPTPEQIATQGTIEGTVVDPSGNPVAGAKILRRKPHEWDLFGPRFHTVTQNDGYYSLGLIDPGIYDIQASRPDGKVFSVDGVVVSPAIVSVADFAATQESTTKWDSDKTRKLEPDSFRRIENAPVAAQGIVRGQIVDESGRGIVGAVIVLDDGDAWFSKTELVSGKGGSFASRPVMWGTFSITAKCAGYGDVVINDIEVMPGQASIVRVPMKAGGSAHKQTLQWTREMVPLATR